MSINFSIKILSPSFERDPLQYELVCLFKRRKVMARALRVSVMCTPPVFDLSVSRDSVVLVNTGQIDNYEIKIIGTSRNDILEISKKIKVFTNSERLLVTMEDITTYQTSIEKAQCL